MHEIVMLMLGLLAQEAVDQIPEHMERLVRRLAARLPGDHAEMMADVWLAELHAIPGKLPKLAYLVPLLACQADVRRAALEDEAQAAHIAQLKPELSHQAVPRQVEDWDVRVLQDLTGLFPPTIEADLIELQMQILAHDKFIGYQHQFRNEAEQNLAASLSSADPEFRAHRNDFRLEIHRCGRAIEDLTDRKRRALYMFRLLLELAERGAPLKWDHLLDGQLE
ncbi:hypothetical protein [Deinococcus rufus]|uniref:Uncharacterized protein n=1 Tax=Deinococcus rufus TaxID=2136097 RepID=A0ABV7Z8Q8_9DEIO